jgi:hypothetical protein
VPYAGGVGADPSPGAVASVAAWAPHNACAGTARSDHGTADLDLSVLGPETTLSQTDGCPADGAADLWTLAGSEHIPNPSNDFAPRLADWLANHHR